jgi:hypothetical protein
VLTCHRARGSKTKSIGIALSPCQRLDPSWLYTALTGAERQVVIVGDPKVIKRTLLILWAAGQRRVRFAWDQAATVACEIHGEWAALLLRLRRTRSSRQACAASTLDQWLLYEGESHPG